ncbi:MAG TPA: hypothetical protein DCO79_11610, partial [Spirochaeta sp.]|nr:hypothetical protein [Spirochaeta sp.]
PLFIGEIRRVSNKIIGPLAIRSSSLTEDSLDKPFAGLFATKMIPNNDPDPNIRFLQLIEAVKFVYSSTWFSSSRDSFKAAGIDLINEKMAVIIQRVHGKKHGQYFYPSFSGVGRSFNHYPFNACSQENGLVELAAGLGKTIVDGGQKWLYSPEKPGAPPPASMKGLLDSGQTKLWTINLIPPEKETPFDETEFMSRQPLKRLEEDGQIENLCSTYSASSDRLEMGYSKNGFKLIDFSPILKGGLFDFNTCISRLMNAFKKRSSSEIEIEFAVNIDMVQKTHADLALLQLRPMKKINSTEMPSMTDFDKSKIIVSSSNALGNIVIDNIEDFVYIHPSAFSAQKTQQMPMEIEKINRDIVNKGKSYILSGFGRWGTSDPSLGIPAKWSQISGARVIIESTLPDMNPELSQGSHFFHNILNTETAYLSIEHKDESKASFIDYEFLENQVIIFKGIFFTHVALNKGVRVMVDGQKRKGMILK